MRAALTLATVLMVASLHAQPATVKMTVSRPGGPAALQALLDKLSAYLVAYEPELGTLIAEESLVQETTGRARRTRPERRRLRSDVAFMRLPGDRAWLGYRDVRRVDEHAVAPSGPGLIDMLARPDRDNIRLASQMAWDSAQHNLGAPRTTNMPGLPLELMHPRHRHRFAFSLGGRARVGRVNVVQVEFDEHVRPSLVRSPDNSTDMPSRGTLWIEPETGRLLKADVRIRDGVPLQGLGARPIFEKPFESQCIVEFVEHRELGLLVPKSMNESFYVPGGSGHGRATYSNFRRFSTSARIVPQ